ncbi:MAG: hypothetical protein J6334_04075 [Kiritimatiellae bacterium]|nr:hypothetical protein [Kiritimatiellia bacterium]
MMMRACFLMVTLALAGGCLTNYYGQYYVTANGMSDTSPLPKKESVSIRKVLSEDDVPRLVDEGYEMIGVSSFAGPYTPLSCAVDTAREHGASLILTDIRFKETQQKLSLMYVPTYSTYFDHGYDFGPIRGRRGWYYGHRPYLATTTVTSLNAFPVQTNVDVYSHDVMFFRKAKQGKAVTNEK